MKGFWYEWILRTVEDTKGVLSSCILNKERQYNGQKKKIPKNKQWSTKHQTKDWAAWNPLISESDRRCSEGVSSPAQHVTPVLLVLNHTNTIWYGNRVGQQYS
jgi:hypothetical protein